MLIQAVSIDFIYIKYYNILLIMPIELPPTEAAFPAEEQYNEAAWLAVVKIQRKLGRKATGDPGMSSLFEKTPRIKDLFSAAYHDAAQYGDTILKIYNEDGLSSSIENFLRHSNMLEGQYDNLTVNSQLLRAVQTYFVSDEKSAKRQATHNLARLNPHIKVTKNHYYDMLVRNLRSGLSHTDTGHLFARVQADCAFYIGEYDRDA